MNTRMLRDLLDRLARLERYQVRYRQGVVTAISPLSVAIGGSDVPYTSVRVLRGAALRIGDPVAVLTFGNDLLVLGAIASTRGPRHVWGIVTSAGAIQSAGSGDWSVVRNAAGDYTITFSPAFAAAPAVVLSSGETATALIVKIFGGVATTTTTARIATVNLSSTLADGPFHFHAIEHG